MSNRNLNKNLHPDIKNYRDIAPESLSNDDLLKLVQENGKNAEAIKAALEALWNEEPAEEWVVKDSKKLKKSLTPPTTNERGGRGRGRSAPPGRGESGRGGRGPGGRSSSVSIQGGRGRGGSTKTENTYVSTPTEISKVEENQKIETINETVYETSTPIVSQPVKSTIAPVWGSGRSLAQKIKEQELAASAPPPPPPPAPVVVAPPAPVVVEEEPVVVVESVEETSNSAPVSTSSAGHSRRPPRSEGGRTGRGRKRGGRDVQPPRVTAIAPEVNSNNNNNNENNNTNDDDNNNNHDSINNNTHNNHVEQIVEENVEEPVVIVEEEQEQEEQQVVEAIQNLNLEKNSEVIHETVHNDHIIQNDITDHNMSDILMSPVRSNNSVSNTIVGSPVLKMGRWGEATDSSFQFGSFVNLGHDNNVPDTDGDESPHKIASGLISSLADSQNSWGQQSQLDQNSLSQTNHETEAVSASLSVWGNSQSQNDNPDDNYSYDQQVSSSANDNSAHSAPPGLGLGLGGLDTSSVVNQSGSNKSGNNNRNSNRSAPGQTRKNDLDNNISRQPQQYYQQVPPGMQPVGGFGIPYGYGFDMGPALQPPLTGYGSTTTQTNSTSPGAPGSNSNGQAVNQNTNNSNQNTSNNYNNNNNSSNNSNNTGNNSNNTGNNAPKYNPAPPGMPAQMGAYPPYYGNPYYQQAFYYGGAQPQSFYGRGGQAMYPPRPYPDPYNPQPIPGYEMYGQPGQFGDAAVYGQIPMQPMHPQQNTTTNDNRQNSGKGGNKNVGGSNTQQSAGAVGGVSGTSSNVGTTQPDANQAIHSGYGMGGYNAYGRADQGAGWAPYQPGWGQMMFPAAPGVGIGGGYSPMGGIPPQPTNNRHDQTSRGGGSYNSYGRGGSTSTNGQNDSTGIGGGTTSSW